EIALCVSHSSLMGSDRMKPRLNWAVMIDSLKEAANTSLSDDGSNMNLSLIKESVLETARRLKNLTADPALIQDPVDVVFISKIAEKYLEFVDQDSELGSVLADIVSSTMSLPKSLLVTAQSLEQACSRLVKVVERLVQLTKALNVHKAECKTIFGKNTFSTPDLDLNLDLSINGSLVYCESSALDHAATEAGNFT
ncbi:unnamed protein product, partial [Timema podura]|nr:unnamed protein product [Timema podura]